MRLFILFLLVFSFPCLVFGNVNLLHSLNIEKVSLKGKNKKLVKTKDEAQFRYDELVSKIQKWKAGVFVFGGAGVATGFLAINSKNKKSILEIKKENLFSQIKLFMKADKTELESLRLEILNKITLIDNRITLIENNGNNNAQIALIQKQLLDLEVQTATLRVEDILIKAEISALKARIAALGG